LVVKAFWQMVHWKGLSPVCVLMWIWSAEDEEKFLLQTWHKCLLGMPANTHTQEMR
jgi:hypothetical protein